MSARILVVDDEPAIVDSVSYALEQAGFEVAAAADASTALELASREEFDAVLLDVMLPDLPGTEVCRRLRDRSVVPIIMLTARGSESDRVLGLELGADDYVVKPFSLAELLARVRSILRRRSLDEAAGRPETYRVGGLELDVRRHEARVDGRTVELTRAEFKLLALLAGEPGRAFTRRELVRHLWSSEFAGGERACDSHVANLRRKIERDPARPQRLLSVRGVGYKLAAV